jgi:hypothetical protein
MHLTGQLFPVSITRRLAWYRLRYDVVWSLHISPAASILPSVAYKCYPGLVSPSWLLGLCPSRIGTHMRTAGIPLLPFRRVATKAQLPPWLRHQNQLICVVSGTMKTTSVLQAVQCRLHQMPLGNKRRADDRIRSVLLTEQPSAPTQHETVR